VNLIGLDGETIKEIASPQQGDNIPQMIPHKGIHSQREKQHPDNGEEGIGWVVADYCS